MHPPVLVRSGFAARVEHAYAEQFGVVEEYDEAVRQARRWVELA